MTDHRMLLAEEHGSAHAGSIVCMAGLALFLAFGAVPAFSQSYWTRLPSPVTRDLNRAFFIDSATGWVVGDQATVIRTADGGQSWTVLDPAIPNSIGDVKNIFMLNKRDLEGDLITPGEIGDLPGARGSKVYECVASDGTGVPQPLQDSSST